jgi:hypothetical protein
MIARLPVALFVVGMWSMSCAAQAANAAQGASQGVNQSSAPVALPAPGMSIPAGTSIALPATSAPSGGDAAKSVAPNADWPAIAKWPDFMGGVWTNDLGSADTTHAPAQPKFRDGVAPAASGNSSSCEPRGIPLDIGGAFFFTKDAVFLMTDFDYFVVRRIDMTRREHGEPELTYYGDSLGRWDGKTLVVDTTGFLPQVQIAEGFPGNSKTRLVEKFRMTAPDRIELEITVTNPDLLQEPWVTTRVLTRHPDWSLHESYCIAHQQS